VFLVNSRLKSFTEISHIIAYTQDGAYPEVTHAVLPNSLTKVLSYTLGFSPHLPVLVCGTISVSLALTTFSWHFIIGI